MVRRYKDVKSITIISVGGGNGVKLEAVEVVEVEEAYTVVECKGIEVEGGAKAIKTIIAPHATTARIIINEESTWA